MALHRDIYWVGRQWAVTGYGVQACDQKQKSKFDIEIDRLWDDDVLESLRAHKWLNFEDLEKALAVARQRFPQPTRKRAPVPRVAPTEPAAQVLRPEAPKPAKPAPVAPRPAPPVALQASVIAATDPATPPPASPKFHMLFSGAARFIRPWRVRMKK
jgi:hypothetical protein